jgi:hypothetical protein
MYVSEEFLNLLPEDEDSQFLQTVVTHLPNNLRHIPQDYNLNPFTSLDRRVEI